jgi:bifunctional DNA-binding transcriptional regulator/antitoxin component of YhaV-PrlF toxin-antitoxin module
MTTYQTKIEMDASGEAYFQIPDELWETLGWEIGDTIDWTDNKDGSYTLRKKDASSTLHNGL